MKGAIIQKEKKEDCYNTFYTRILGDSGGVYTKMTMAKEDYISMALIGKINQFPIRPILWKILLRLIPIEKPFFEWLSAQEQLRISYKSKKAKKTPGIKDLPSDPLNKHSEEWKVYYEEKDLMKLIKLDLDRGEEQDDQVKKMLSDILLIWSRDNKAVSYHQGMNEIITTIFQALIPYYFQNEESLAKEDLLIIYNNSTLRSNKSDVLYLYFHDQRELESDIYHIFNAIMQKGIMPLFDSTNELRSIDLKDKDTAIQERVNQILKKLKMVDNELYYHFAKIQIAPETFLQRWIQCMLIREFPSQLVIELWDAIFAYEFVDSIINKTTETNFLFLDDIILAMITRLREDLLQKDQNECFMTLYDYPRISPGTLLKESGDIRTKLDSIKKKSDKGDVHKKDSKVIIKNIQSKNKLIPDDILNAPSSDIHYQSLNKNCGNKYGSLSSFLQNSPQPTTNNTETNKAPNNNTNNTETNKAPNNNLIKKKDQMQTAFVIFNDIYEKYKHNYSENDLKKFQSALNILNEFK